MSFCDGNRRECFSTPAMAVARPFRSEAQSRAARTSTGVTRPLFAAEMPNDLVADGSDLAAGIRAGEGRHRVVAAHEPILIPSSTAIFGFEACSGRSPYLAWNTQVSCMLPRVPRTALQKLVHCIICSTLEHTWSRVTRIPATHTHAVNSRSQGCPSNRPLEEKYLKKFWQLGSRIS